MSKRKEVLLPALCILWILSTWAVATIERGFEPMLGGPWWIRLITGPICIAWAAYYVWRGRRSA